MTSRVSRMPITGYSENDAVKSWQMLFRRYVTPVKMNMADGGGHAASYPSELISLDLPSSYALQVRLVVCLRARIAPAYSAECLVAL